MEILFDTIENTPIPKYETCFKSIHKGWDEYKFNLVIDGEVVGSVIIDTNYFKTTIKLYCVEIFPAFRKKGYGKILLQEIEKWSVRNKYKNIALSVENNNIIALNLYKKFGFEVICNDTIDMDMLLKIKRRAKRKLKLAFS